MLKWFTPFVVYAALLSGSVIADKPLPALKVGDLVHLHLIGDASRKYASMNGGSFDNAETTIPMLSAWTIVRSLNDDSEIYIEHKLETSVDEKRYLCTLKGTLPAKSIYFEPVLDLTDAEKAKGVV